MKLPIRRVPGTSPPKFEYSQTINLLTGGTQQAKHVSCVSPSLEEALCELLIVAQKLIAENASLRGKK